MTGSHCPRERERPRDVLAPANDLPLDPPDPLARGEPGVNHIPLPPPLPVPKKEKKKKKPETSDREASERVMYGPGCTIKNNSSAVGVNGRTHRTGPDIASAIDSWRSVHHRSRRCYSVHGEQEVRAASPDVWVGGQADGLTWPKPAGSGSGPVRNGVRKKHKKQAAAVQRLWACLASRQANNRFWPRESKAHATPSVPTSTA